MPPPGGANTAGIFTIVLMWRLGEGFFSGWAEGPEGEGWDKFSLCRERCTMEGLVVPHTRAGAPGDCTVRFGLV